MNPITDLIFTLSWFILLIWAIRSMAKGMAIDPKEIKYTESKKQVTKPPHPELAEVKPGDELLVVSFTPDDEFNRKVTDGFLQQSLKDRIDELVEDDEDDDDDDGGAPVLA